MKKRRHLLKLVAGASSAVWTKPVVESVLLPAHAGTTDGGGDPSGGTTVAPTPPPPVVVCSMEVLRFSPPSEDRWNLRVTATITGPGNYEGVELSVELTLNTGSFGSPDVFMTDANGQISEIFGTMDVCSGTTQATANINVESLNISTSCMISTTFECSDSA